MVTKREFWWSPELGLNLLSIVDSPQFGKQVFQARDVTTTPPEAGLFVEPDDSRSSTIEIQTEPLSRAAGPSLGQIGLTKPLRTTGAQYDRLARWRDDGPSNHVS